MYQISDNFNSYRGYWPEDAPWDATEKSHGAKSFLSTQQHVDLRSFRTVGDAMDVPQRPDLTSVTQTSIDALAQTALETKTGVNVAEENWTLIGSGLNAITVGKMSGRGGWSGLTTTTNGSAVSATLTSSTPGTRINVGVMDKLSLIFPNYNSFDTATSYVQLCSNAAGDFSSNVSRKIWFNENDSVMPQLRFPMDNLYKYTFETSIADWGVTGMSTLAQDTAHASGGTKALKVTTTASRTSGTVSPAFVADGSSSIGATGQVWVPTGSTVRYGFINNSPANRIGNGGFETNVAGWTVYQGSISRSTSEAYEGTASMAIFANLHTWAGAGYDVTGLTVGKEYVFSAWAKIPVGETFRMDATGTTIDFAPATNTGWNKYSIKFTATSTSHTMFFQVKDNSVAYTYYVDKIVLAPTDEVELGTIKTITGNDAFQVLGTGTFVPPASPSVSFFVSSPDSNSSVYSYWVDDLAINNGFASTAVSGIKIYLAKSVAPTANQTVSLMGIRGLKSTWAESALDFDTRIGALCRPVTLDGANYAGTTAAAFEFIRGDGTKLDPYLTDGATAIYFCPGGGTSPNDATGATYNEIALLFRETKDTGAGTGSHIEAGIKFQDTNTVTFTSKKVSTTGGSPGTQSASGTYTENTTINWNGAGLYMFKVELVGTTIIPRLYSVNWDKSNPQLLWAPTSTITSTHYTTRNGRVGFRADLKSRDAFVWDFEASTIGYSVLRSQVRKFRTPVDSLKLTAQFSADQNLFTYFTAPDLLTDQTKLVNGMPSYRSSVALTTNTFVVEDWLQTYLHIQLWVGNTLTSRNKPRILVGTTELPAKDIKPNQWNDINYDLSLLKNLTTGTPYQISIAAALQPDTFLGNFWVGDVMVGRRRVAWSARATANGPFREFKNTVNSSTGALHFNPEERGTDVQLQAIALTPDAWVASSKLRARLAELGNPLYDQAYDKS